MHTLVDFITQVKGIEYILSILFIGGFLLFWEILKPRPFATVVSAGKDDLEHIRQNGYRETMKFAGKIAAAPFSWAETCPLNGAPWRHISPVKKGSGQRPTRARARRNNCSENPHSMKGTDQ
jgi:hypothetical protein